MTPLVVPEVSGARAMDLVRRLAEVINAITRLKAALAWASDGQAPEAWNERRRMLENLDRDLRDLALALQERGGRGSSTAS